MMHRKLFHNLADTQLVAGEDLLPPAGLAFQVLRQLPESIRAWDSGTPSFAGMRKQQQAMLRKEAARIQAIQDGDEAARTQLDLLMLLGAYLPAGPDTYKSAPPLLLELLEQNATRHELPLRMTYELIVDVNAREFVRSGDIRVFADGEIGRIERDFYIGHYFAEQHMRLAYEVLKGILDQPKRRNKKGQLRIVHDQLIHFTEYMAAYSRLPQVEYSYFRRFLKPYPDKVKNASGAFMPSPQLFEMLLHKPGYAQAEFIATNMHYFSRWAQPLLQTQQAEAHAGRTLEAMAAGGGLPLDTVERQLLSDVLEQFIRFKLTHIGVASSKIPEAFPEQPLTGREDLRGFCPFLGATRDGAGAEQGTGGFMPQDFLGDGIRRLLDLQQRLTAHL